MQMASLGHAVRDYRGLCIVLLLGSHAGPQSSLPVLPSQSIHVTSVKESVGSTYKAISPRLAMRIESRDLEPFAVTVEAARRDL